jgi:hypothetical protein
LGKSLSASHEENNERTQKRGVAGSLHDVGQKRWEKLSLNRSANVVRNKSDTINLMALKNSAKGKSEKSEANCIRTPVGREGYTVCKKRRLQIGSRRFL